jgi:hypothetical protein
MPFMKMWMVHLTFLVLSIPVVHFSFTFIVIVGTEKNLRLVSQAGKNSISIPFYGSAKGDNLVKI